MTTPHHELIERIRARAENRYATRQCLCAEAILVTLNEALGGGLSESQAMGLAAGLTVGVGHSGCLCGAVSGGVMAMGLLLGAAGQSRKDIRAASGELHAAFKNAHGSACCRVLSKKVKDDAAAHFAQCQGLTGECAALAARIILARRPELAAEADGRALARRDSMLCGRVKWLVRLLCP